MATLAMLAVAVSATEIRFSARVNTGPVRIVYSTTEPSGGVPMDAPAYSSSATVDATGAAKVTVTGLSASTRYWWRVEDAGVVDDSGEWTATVLTPPPAGTAASYVFGASGDAGNGGPVPGFTGDELLPDRISNHEVHRHIGERAVAEDWLAEIELGDIAYYNLGQDTYPAATIANYRRTYDDLWLQPNQSVRFRSASFIHGWDDHDFGPNDSDGTHAGKTYVAQAFREREPHHNLPDTGAIYRTWTWGRVQYILWDCRYYRSPNTDPDGPSKTMLGSAQKAWFEAVLAASTAEVICIISSVQWMAGGADSWPGFATERAEIAAMIEDAGKASRVFMLSADAHYLAIDTGGGNAWGGWPCAVFASRDSQPSMPQGVYDTLEQGGRGQYGTVTVTDLGSLITVKLTAWQDGTEVGSYTKAYPTSTPTVVADLAEVVSGSHTALVEARVVTEYQTGPDPDGTRIDVLSGDVQWDETAEVWSTMSLSTPGVDENDRPLFPRRADDLLMPYGNEVYLRYGIDLGSEVLWTPLGYYRLDDADTPRDDAPISLTGQDRWSGLAEAELLFPRQYQATQTLAAVVYDLVGDIYPAAIIAWDDDTEQLPLGRTLLVEKSRTAALRDIATSHGKVVYWDGEGVLRFEAAPVETDIVWELTEGEGGVLIEAGRSVSRDGVYNAVVATGSEAGAEDVIGIMIDIGPDSPTRWGGRFGQKIKRYSSPLLRSNAAARAAAATILRRSVGMPQAVNFGSVPLPTLRPRQGVRITTKRGRRERHVISALTLPLTGGAMTGDTREQTLTQVGSLLPGDAVASIDNGG